MRIVIFLILAFPATTCSLSPSAGQFSCIGDDDCPPGWHCNPGDQKCYDDTDDFPQDSGSDHSTDTGSSDTDSESSSEMPQNMCEAAQLINPQVICCPQNPPSDCEDASWQFPEAGSPLVGCCTQNIEDVIRCRENETLTPPKCIEGQCGYDFEASMMDCMTNSCPNPIMVSNFPTTVDGDWSKYANNFIGGDNCGDAGGGWDVWLAVFVPPNQTATVHAALPDNATLRLVENCNSDNCITNDPQNLSLVNNSGNVEIFHVVPGQTTNSGSDYFNITVSLN